jgi:hypothetical protein
MERRATHFYPELDISQFSLKNRRPLFSLLVKITKNLKLNTLEVRFYELNSRCNTQWKSKLQLEI